MHQIFLVSFPLQSLKNLYMKLKLSIYDFRSYFPTLYMTKKNAMKELDISTKLAKSFDNLILKYCANGFNLIVKKLPFLNIFKTMIE